MNHSPLPSDITKIYFDYYNNKRCSNNNNNVVNNNITKTTDENDDHDHDVTVESTLISLFDSFSELFLLYYKKMKIKSLSHKRSSKEHHSYCWYQYIQHAEIMLRELNDLLLLGTSTSTPLNHDSRRISNFISNLIIQHDIYVDHNKHNEDCKKTTTFHHNNENDNNDENDTKIIMIHDDDDSIQIINREWNCLNHYINWIVVNKQISLFELHTIFQQQHRGMEYNSAINTTIDHNNTNDDDDDAYHVNWIIQNIYWLLHCHYVFQQCSNNNSNIITKRYKRWQSIIIETIQSYQRYIITISVRREKQQQSKSKSISTKEESVFNHHSSTTTILCESIISMILWHQYILPSILHVKKCFLLSFIETRDNVNSDIAKQESFSVQGTIKSSSLSLTTIKTKVDYDTIIMIDSTIIAALVQCISNIALKWIDVYYYYHHNAFINKKFSNNQTMIVTTKGLEEGKEELFQNNIHIIGTIINDSMKLLWMTTNNDIVDNSNNDYYHKNNNGTILLMNHIYRRYYLKINHHQQQNQQRRNMISKWIISSETIMASLTCFNYNTLFQDDNNDDIDDDDDDNNNKKPQHWINRIITTYDDPKLFHWSDISIALLSYYGWHDRSYVWDIAYLWKLYFPYVSILILYSQEGQQQENSNHQDNSDHDDIDEEIDNEQYNNIANRERKTSGTEIYGYLGYDLLDSLLQSVPDHSILDNIVISTNHTFKSDNGGFDASSSSFSSSYFQFHPTSPIGTIQLLLNQMIITSSSSTHNNNNNNNSMSMIRSLQLDATQCYRFIQRLIKKYKDNSYQFHIIHYIYQHCPHDGLRSKILDLFRIILLTTVASLSSSTSSKGRSYESKIENSNCSTTGIQLLFEYIDESFQRFEKEHIFLMAHDNTEHQQHNNNIRIDNQDPSCKNTGGSQQITKSFQSSLKEIDQLINDCEVYQSLLSLIQQWLIVIVHDKFHHHTLLKDDNNNVIPSLPKTDLDYMLRMKEQFIRILQVLDHQFEKWNTSTMISNHWSSSNIMISSSSSSSSPPNDVHRLFLLQNSLQFTVERLSFFIQ